MAELLKALLNLTILGFVLFLAWWTTRLIGARMGASVRGGAMRVLHHLPAGRDRSVMLLEVGGKVYLLGVTGEQINLLDAIDDPAQIRRILEGTPAPTENPLGQLLPSSFHDALTRALGTLKGVRTTNQAPSGPAPQEPADAARLQEQLERLRRLQQK